MDRLTIHAHGRTFRTLHTTVAEVPWFNVWLDLHPNETTLKLDMCAWALSDILNFLRTGDLEFLKEENVAEQRFLGLLLNEQFEYTEDTDGLLVDIIVEGHVRRIRPYILNKIPMVSAVCSGRWSGNELDVDVNHFDAIVAHLNGETINLTRNVQVTMNLMGVRSLDNLENEKEQDSWDEAAFALNPIHNTVILFRGRQTSNQFRPQKVPWNMQLQKHPSTQTNSNMIRFNIPRTGHTISDLLFVFPRLTGPIRVDSLLKSVTLIIGGQYIRTLQSEILGRLCVQRDNVVELSMFHELSIEIDEEELGFPVGLLRLHSVHLEVCCFDPNTQFDVFLHGWYLSNERHQRLVNQSETDIGVRFVTPEWSYESWQTDMNGRLDQVLPFCGRSMGIFIFFKRDIPFKKHPLIHLELTLDRNVIYSGSWHLFCRDSNEQTLVTGHYFIPLQNARVDYTQNLHLVLETHTPKLTIDVVSQGTNILILRRGMGGMGYSN